MLLILNLKVIDFCTVGTTLFEVETFDLTGNKLKSISKILKYKDILTVKIAKNQIQYLTNEDFRFVHKTEHLELQENQIRRIDKGTFKPIRASLSYLDLSSNSISSLNGSVRYLSQIRKLFVTNNLIQVTSFSVSTCFCFQSS